MTRATMNATGTTTGRRRLAALALVVLVVCPAVSYASLAQPTNSMEAGIRNAILRGDTQELRTLLGQAGDLSSSDAAIARRALASMEKLAAEDAQALARRYGLDWANTLQHALKTAADGPVKQALLQQYGSPEKVFVQLDQVVAAFQNVPEGKFTREIVLDGIKVIVRCFGKGGIAILRTIDKW